MTTCILRAQNARQVDEYCRLMVRKGGGLVLIQRIDAAGQPKGNPFSVDRSRLRELTDRSRLLADDKVDALPWDGKGDDPLRPVDRSGPAAHRAFFS